MSGRLREQFDYFVKHHDELLAAHRGKVVVIKDEKVVGEFADDLSAFVDAQVKYEPGSYLIQRIEPGDASYTQAFHSRVAFS